MLNLLSDMQLLVMESHLRHGKIDESANPVGGRLSRSAGTAFVERNRAWIRWTHIKVLLAIARCRTVALGGYIDECTRCGHTATISYNSCRNRHCPKCQTGAGERWIQAR